MPKGKSKSLSGEHIFPNTELQVLVVRWKECVSANKEGPAMELLETIVDKSTEMLKRLAQHEGYHHTQDLGILVSAAQSKIVKWIDYWEPNKGKLFAWFSVCAKNAFKSELHKVNQFRKRTYVTSDNLEQLYGSEDHSAYKNEAADEARKKLKDVTCRWGSKQERGAISYLMECILDGDHSKQDAVRAGAYSWGISIELSKFFYAWTLTMFRDQMFHKIHIPFTEQDLFVADNSYEHFTSLFSHDNTPLNFEHAKYICAVYGGMRLKIPTLAQMAKVKEDYAIFKAIDKSDLDPDSVAKIGKKFGVNSKVAQEAYTDMVDMLNPQRCGDFDVYDQDT